MTWNCHLAIFRENDLLWTFANWRKIMTAKCYYEIKAFLEKSKNELNYESNHHIDKYCIKRLLDLIAMVTKTCSENQFTRRLHFTRIVTKFFLCKQIPKLQRLKNEQRFTLKSSDNLVFWRNFWTFLLKTPFWFKVAWSNWVKERADTENSKQISNFYPIIS